MTRPSSCRRLLPLVAALLVSLTAVGSVRAADLVRSVAVPAAGPPYVPGVVVVGYAVPSRTAAAEVGRTMGVRAAAGRPAQQLVHLPRGMSMRSALHTLRGRPDVAYAVPDYIAHQAGAYIPDDPGRGTIRGGWQGIQWNFLAADGVNAPEAWANLRADHRAGARGEVVAILDTGVAYRDWRRFRRSPDFSTTRFIDPYDFVNHNAYPLDREGHGTFVAGVVAESTNNGVNVTGLAYNATIMPVRVLDADGNGNASTIAKGIRYAVTHGANVINLSLEFGLGVGAGSIPEVISAIRFAHRHGVVVVGAGGNDEGTSLAYPAKDPLVISVGATTRDRCVADYSNAGTHLDLVAPGGGDDLDLSSDPDCHPAASLPDVYQTTFFTAVDPARFGLPAGWYGTSMAAPHVAAAAAMVIASGVIGRHPSPQRVLVRLEQTADRLGTTWPNPDYGYGLVNIGAATSRQRATTEPVPPPTSTTPTTPTTTAPATTPTATTPASPTFTSPPTG